MSKNLKVIKLNGEKEPFSEEKIRASATRVGVPKNLQDEMLSYIKKRAHNNMPTSEIFSLIKKFLKKSNADAYSTKYNLKQSLLELGPSGYPFEKYLSYILESLNYQTKINQTLQGKCVQHEIDVIAEGDNQNFIVEAKFHNKPGIKSQIKTTLYVQARFLDLKPNLNQSARPWLITNTRFTTQAKKYAKCVNLKLTSWDYPQEKSLRRLIDQTALHPVTILDTLTSSQQKTLLENSIVTCQQIKAGKAKPYLPQNHSQVQQEAEALCNL